jgi:mannose-1-phosphate guanylyltransferase
MKAFLLAAGLGTRLKPLTDTIPKCLLPIRGTPLLAIWLDLCAQAGIDSVLINVHAHSDAVKQFLATRRLPVFAEIVEEDKLLGSAGTIAANRSWITGEPDFFILYGDVLTNADLRLLWHYHYRNDQVATLGLYRVPDPSRCGVVTLSEAGVITKFEEKPAVPTSNLVFSGIMIARAEFVNWLPNETPADIGYHVLPRLAGRMAGYEIVDYLKDIGTVQTYHEVQQRWPGLKQEQRC